MIDRILVLSKKKIAANKSTFLSPRFNIYLISAILFGIITTIKTYSGYGVGNHIEQLPLILRSLDSNYLLNDFFVNEGIKSIARQNYISLISAIAGSKENLPVTFFLLTLISNISISVITFLSGYKVFNNSNLTGLVASAFVMSIYTFSLGRFGISFQGMLLPSSIAYPFVLAAILFILNDKLLIGIILCSLISLIHPLIGIEVGGILFIIFFSFSFLSKEKITKHKYLEIIFSFIIFSAFTLITVIPQMNQQEIDNDIYIYILAYFRHPHHYIPSSFSIYSYIFSMLFSASMFITYFSGQKYRDARMNFKLAILIITIFSLFICGYIFVEIIPIRQWVIAQTFRLTYLLQWIGLIIISGFLLEKKLTFFSKVLFMLSAFEVTTLFLYLIFNKLKNEIKKTSLRHEQIINYSLNILIIIIFTIITTFISKVPLINLVLYIFIICSLQMISDKFLYRGGLMIITIIISMGGICNYLQINNLNPIPLEQLSSRVYNVESELDKEGDEIIEYIKVNTPAEAIFLTPHNWGQFRITAERAIVVDFKAFPFSNYAILEWYKRIVNCYGNADSSFTEKTVKPYDLLVADFIGNYKKIDDTQLSHLSSLYNISYAVIFEQTPTNFETVFRNGKYKLISLNDKR
jgi:hypothetical protein